MSSFTQNFDLTDGFNILRIICGAFLVPHIYAKFYVPEALGFFVAAKFNPPAVWMYISCVIETVLAIALIFGIYTVYAGRHRRSPPRGCDRCGLSRHRRQMAVEHRRL